MILHALQQKTIVVVCSKDTNVLGLMVFMLLTNLREVGHEKLE